MTEVKVLNGTLREGDGVVVAAGRRNSGLRVGRVLEILPGIAGYNQRNGPVRIRVWVTAASGLTGKRLNPATGEWEFFPFAQVYDDPDSMVKL